MGRELRAEPGEQRPWRTDEFAVLYTMIRELETDFALLLLQLAASPLELGLQICRDYSCQDSWQRKPPHLIRYGERHPT